MDNELLKLAAELREGFHALQRYLCLRDPDEDDDDENELKEDEIKVYKAHRAADRLTQIERERAGQMRVDSE